jgi:iron complex outermembrane receptor protein
MKTNGINVSARLLCGAATFLALAATGAPALAQAADEQAAAAVEGQDEDDAIVVTGIRSSIQTSLDAKRQATSIVEVIAAEDIGLLPDLSIADTLARLPGVTAQRVRGRSQQISIRGLGPDFSLALLNGREVVSAGNNRGIEFDQFPSELIGSGVVYKTGDAQIAAIGIAGAVDLRTLRPLDSKGRQITASATYTINDSGQRNPDFADDGYRFFGSYIDQNDAGTLGWSLGVTVQSIPTQFISRELKTNQFQVGRTAAGVIYPADNPRQGVVSRSFERTSIAGTLQFEPTAATPAFSAAPKPRSPRGAARPSAARRAAARLPTARPTGTSCRSCAPIPKAANPKSSRLARTSNGRRPTTSASCSTTAIRRSIVRTSITNPTPAPAVPVRARRAR